MVEEHGAGVLAGVGSVVGVEHRVQDLECKADKVVNVGEMESKTNVVVVKEEMDCQGLDQVERFEDLKEEDLDMVSDYPLWKLYIQGHYFRRKISASRVSLGTARWCPWALLQLHLGVQRDLSWFSPSPYGRGGRWARPDQCLSLSRRRSSTTFLSLQWKNSTKCLLLSLWWPISTMRCLLLSL